MKSKPSNFIALDIGSSKVAAIITNFDKKLNISVAHQSLQYSSGFKSSMITDFKEAEETILRTVYALELESAKSIKEVHVLLAGSYTKSFYIDCSVKCGNRPITNKDVKILIDKALGEFRSKDYEIIEYFPIEFCLDENSGIKSPLGLIGKELTCRIHAVAANNSLITNLINCFAKCQIQISSFNLAIHAAGLACLSEDDKNLGAIIIDMGAQITSFGVFWLGKFIYSGFVNLGSDHITSDIAKVFSISSKSAEKLKILYGGATTTSFEKNKSINIEQIGNEDYENGGTGILIEKLNAVIAARLEEILNKIKTQCKVASFDGLIDKRIVVTGGGSSLRGLKEFMGKIFDRQIRIAKPLLLPGFKEDHNPPAYSAIVGSAINYAFKQQKNYENNAFDNEPSWLTQTIKWVKENI